MRRTPGALSCRFAARSVVPLVLLGLLVTASCSQESPSSPAASVEHGPLPQLDMAFALAGRLDDTLGLVVARDGVIVRQGYSHGGGPDTPQLVRSVTKSVVSLLVGTALDRGCLQSIDQPIGSLLGPLGPSDPARAAVTVRHLLSMTSGLGGNELADMPEYGRWWQAPNQVAYVWNQPIEAAPGTRFAYYSPAFHLLSPILARTCGQSLPDYARDALFTPMGLGTRSWEIDSQGFANAAAGLSLTPRDMVAIGTLVLNGGMAGGRQVVAAEWVRNATRRQVATSAQPHMSGYGFGWWTGTVAGTEFFCANGFGGQFIVVVPSKRLVVVAQSRLEPTIAAGNEQWNAVLHIILERIVPAF